MARYSSHCLVFALGVLTSGCQNSFVIPATSIPPSANTAANGDLILPLQQTSPRGRTLGSSPGCTPDYQNAALVNVKLGLAYLEQGHIARAKSKLITAAAMAPNLPEPQLAMAHFFEQMGQIIEAEKAHKKALKLGNGKGAVCNNYGAFLSRQARFEEADYFFQRALRDKFYPYTAEVYENAGLTAMQGQHLERAEYYLSMAIRHDPKRHQAMLALAKIKQQQAHPSLEKRL